MPLRRQPFQAYLEPAVVLEASGRDLAFTAGVPVAAPLALVDFALAVASRHRHWNFRPGRDILDGHLRGVHQSPERVPLDEDRGMLRCQRLAALQRDVCDARRGHPEGDAGVQDCDEDRHPPDDSSVSVPSRHHTVPLVCPMLRHNGIVQRRERKPPDPSPTTSGARCRIKHQSGGRPTVATPSKFGAIAGPEVVDGVGLKFPGLRADGRR